MATEMAPSQPLDAETTVEMLEESDNHDVAEASASGARRDSVPAAPGKRLMITKMQLENFKSYAGRIEIGPFHKCFSAVVGPNGSGKSNVIDALLFVFGKRASKLRLKKVSELVHRSAAFPDLDTATVSVFFHEIYDESGVGGNNGDDETYRVVPGSEFSVTRTASKSNSSKYFINDKPSNFTQVTALLREKGIDLDNNRFLILQGEVEQIAMMKSKGDGSGNDDGLLEYLEDIIGSNVYVEPTEKVWQEVEECNEIRIEKVNRVKLVEKEKAHLEGPRAEALDYLRKEKEVYLKTNILYQLWIQEAAKNRELCEAKKNELQTQYEEELKKMEANRLQLQELESVYKQVKEEHDASVGELESAKAIYADYEKQDVKLREELKFSKERLAELEGSKKKELKQQKEIARKEKENDELAPQLEKEIEKLQVKLKKQEQIIESILQEHKQETEKLRTEMEAVQQEMEPHQTQLNSLRSEIDMFDTEIQLIEEPSKYSQQFRAVKGPSGQPAPRLFDLVKVKDKKHIEKLEVDLPKIDLNLGAAKTKLKDLTQNHKDLEKKCKISEADKKKIAKLEKQKEAKESEYSQSKQQVDGMEAKLAQLKKKIMDVGGAKLRKEQEVANKVTKEIEDKTKQMTKIRVEYKSSQKNREKNAKALESIENEMAEVSGKIDSIRAQCKEMEEKAMDIVQKREEIEEVVSAKEKALRKEEKKYTKLKKQFDEMRSEGSADTEEDDDEPMDDDDNEDEDMESTDLKALPILDPKQLAKYNKEEMKYEISVLEQQRDELKANYRFS
ncbi:hypothetical protein P43SY_000300 [Pythium insidiosum]|uniref:RecF/RecN/SMC N-terminal domain-containing protein n=1 Tax=Pythium insidiosum TaxID=114742 RepID=A0AAD5QA93_PYTIN|nr:hypothetical protein P43SY_000300 [Pythium insidiosum]